MNNTTKNVDVKEISLSNLIGAIFSWIVTVVWMLEIFRLSSETGDQSSLRSNTLLIFIIKTLKISFLDEAMLRVGAHVFEYALLALLIYVSMRFTNKIIYNGSNQEFSLLVIKSDNELYILVSLWISFLFAILDEYHQLFVIGRDGSIIDVLIDGIGIVIVLLFANIISSLKLFRLKRKSDRY